MQLEDIKKLANMARLDMTDQELTELANDFEPILAYVGQVGEVEQSQAKVEYTLENVMREDIATNKTGEYTDKIIEQMPDSQDGFLKVKQIL
jgi:aspartyl-tRNA(Asn)/glutamyl-tRNA(Gln) amidotransferase subunit C